MDEGQAHEEESPDTHKNVRPFMEVEGDQVVDEGLEDRVFNPFASQKDSQKEGTSPPWTITAIIVIVISYFKVSVMITKTHFIQSLYYFSI